MVRPEGAINLRYTNYFDELTINSIEVKYEVGEDS